MTRSAQIKLRKARVHIAWLVGELEDWVPRATPRNSAEDADERELQAVGAAVIQLEKAVEILDQAIVIGGK